MLKINTAAILTPSDFSVGIMDITKADRSASGKMKIQKIATKRKIEVTYKYLSRSQLATLLQSISSTFFTVEYPDPQTGTLRSGTFYCGDRNAAAMDYIDGTIRWKDIKFNFIEQ